MIPTLPFVSGMFFTYQSMVSYVSVIFCGPRKGRFIRKASSEVFRESFASLVSARLASTQNDLEL